MLLFGSLLKLQIDDWIMGLFVFGAYTTLLITANIEMRAQSNLLKPGYPISELTHEEISKRIYGSKMVIVVEQMYIAAIWGCKACLLILYYRLTFVSASISC